MEVAPGRAEVRAKHPDGDKYETMTKMKMLQCKNIEFPMDSFRSFCHLVFEFVSNFGFRYSDFA